MQSNCTFRFYFELYYCATFSSVVQDAASKKSNNLLLDTSDLAISQYSLLGQTPPRTAPDSPNIHPRDSSSAVPDENQESTTKAEQDGQAVTADICPLSDPGDEKPDPSTTSHQNTVLVSPVIVVTQQFDESVIQEVSGYNETSEEVQPGAEKPSTSDSATTVTPDSNAAVTHEAGTTDPPSTPESTNPIPDSPKPSTLSSQQSTDVPAECDQSASETSATSEHISEDASSSKGDPIKISLGSLSEAIGCSSTAASVAQISAQQPTDRAVYLTGDIKGNWEVERAKEEEKGAAEEKSEERVEDEDKGSEEAEESGDHEEKEEKVEEELLQSSEPTEVQPEDSAELPMDSVALIRELVTEITEVKMEISPCPNSSNMP